jgi:5-methylcytosine-specific restriction endonuclease McrA
MPTRPAIHQPTFAKTPEQREAAERERQRRKDAARPSSTERGYDREWRELRASFVADNPTCSVEGCGKPTVDVDHIRDVRAHPESRLDRSNLRPYCHAHHAQRTAREQGFARPREAKEGPRVSTRGSLLPDWLRPSRVPLRLVCGPPAAGKAAYVEERSTFTEIVLDLDVIRADLSGMAIYQPGYAWLNEAIRHRNSVLGSLSSPYVKLGGAWLIVPAPKADTRAWWRTKLRPLSVVVLATPAEECHRRIDADPRRALVRDQHHAAVDRWWAEYQPSAEDREARPRSEIENR